MWITTVKRKIFTSAILLWFLLNHTRRVAAVLTVKTKSPTSEVATTSTTGLFHQDSGIESTSAWSPSSDLFLSASLVRLYEMTTAEEYIHSSMRSPNEQMTSKEQHLTAISSMSEKSIVHIDDHTTINQLDPPSWTSPTESLRLLPKNHHGVTSSLIINVTPAASGNEYQNAMTNSTVISGRIGLPSQESQSNLIPFSSGILLTNQSPSVWISVSTAVSTSTSTRIFTRSSNNKQQRKQPGFQDIISGLVKLLGGKNVRVANGYVPPALINQTNDGDLGLFVSRINNRAPPKVTFAELDNNKSSIKASMSANLKTSTIDMSASMKLSSFSHLEILPTATLKIPVPTTISVSAIKNDKSKVTILEDNLSSSLNKKEKLDLAESTESLIIKTQKVDDIPTGPVTEWLPAHRMTGYSHKGSSTNNILSTQTTYHQLLSTTGSTVAATVTKNSKLSSEIINGETKSKLNTETHQLPTEISYAEYDPTKPLEKESVASTRFFQLEVNIPGLSVDHGKSSVEQMPSLKSSSLFLIPSPGVVLPVAKPDELQPKGDTTASSTSADGGSGDSVGTTRSPTGSPFVIPVDIQKIRLGTDEDIGPGVHIHGNDQSVFIDGRKTYFNLMPTESDSNSDTTLVNVGIGYSFPSEHEPGGASQGSVSNVRLNQPKPANRLPTQLVRVPQRNKVPVRIDTCIIGDESACNVKWNETCRVEAGVSSCNCRLGYGRDGLEEGCKPTVSLTVYIKVDRVNHEQISFGPEYQNPSSEKYQILEYEAKNAVDSAFSLSSMADNFLSSAINSFFSVGGKVIINATVNLLETSQTHNPTIKQSIRRSLISVIQQQKQNIGQSRLYINGPLNPIPGVQDLDECADPNLNDCSKYATCLNSFGSFKCACLGGFIDKYGDDPRRSGRICAVCSPQHCNNRGECVVTDGKRECRCHGHYIGSNCETDGEVLGVALGASLAALVIIVLTLVCLCMWSRRWKRDQEKMLGRTMGTTLSNNYNHFNKPSAQTADFHLPGDDRIRWPPHSLDSMDNYYAPEPITAGPNIRGFPMTRPPSQPPPPPPAPVTSSAAHRAVQHLRSLPSSLTGSRSKILDDTDEGDDVGIIETNRSRFFFSRTKTRGCNKNHGNYYDVAFPNNREQYAYAYDKDYGNVSNAFPMKAMRPSYN